MERSMSQKLNIRAFFFNAKTDYLPYYKNFTINIEKDTTAKDILHRIQEQNEYFTYPKDKLIMKINGYIVEGKELASSIVEKLGTELSIEPVNNYRSNNGLEINDDDFMQSFALLEPYATESDLKYYKTLYALHYASETEKFDHAYIGDAILVLAHKMISEGNEHKEEILHAITSAHSGLLDCEYENNLFNAQQHEATIIALKDMVKNDDNEHPSLLDMIKERFTKKNDDAITLTPSEKVREIKTIEDLQDKRIAYNAGTAIDNTVEKLCKKENIHLVPTSRRDKLSGLNILDDNKTLAFKKAATTLLDAFDSGAEVLVLEDGNTYDMMTNHFKKIEKTIGRGIIGLELMTAKDFALQVNKITA